MFSLVLTLRELYIGNKLFAKLKATNMQHTLLTTLKISALPSLKPIVLTVTFTGSYSNVV